MLAEYRVNITYKPGTQNIVADALSRRADHVREVKTEDLPEILQQIREAYKRDKDFKRIVEIKNPDKYDNLRHTDKHFPEYSLKQDLLFKGDRICVPRSVHQQVMQEFHNVPTAEHLGGRHMYIVVRENFY